MTLLNSYQQFLDVRRLQNPNKMTKRQKRLIFLVDEILDLTTYCEEYSVEIGERILDVMKYIYYKHNPNDESVTPNYDYSRDIYELEFIVYVQFIIQYLEWGTSIYTAWFDSSKKIFECTLNPQNVKFLINWLDCNND